MSDYRLYVVESGWRVLVKPDDGKQLFCFLKEEGEESYPRIIPGEIYLTNDVEVFNLNSAVKKGIVQVDRPILGTRPRRSP